MRYQPQGLHLPPRTATYVVAASDAPAHVKAQADYVCDGVADDVEIQAAIGALMSERTWTETVKCFGSFSLANTVTVASYTRLDLTEAKISLANGINITMFVNSNRTGAQSHIYILGGEINGNKANQAASGNRLAIDLMSNPGPLTYCEIDGVFAHDTDGTGIAISFDNSKCAIRNCRVTDARLDGIYYQGDGGIIEGNFIYGSGDVGIAVDAVGSEEVIVANNDVAGSTNSNIGWGPNSTGPILIRGNLAHDGASHGFIGQSTPNVNIIGNSAYDNAGNGFNLENDGCDFITLDGNSAYSNAQHGFLIVTNPSQLVISNNIAAWNNRCGLAFYHNIVDVVFIGNIVFDNGQNPGGFDDDGINISDSGVACSNFVIVGNRITDRQGTKTQNAGIQLAGLSTEILISNNDLQGNKTYAINNGASGTVTKKDNRGYVTENSGASTGTGAQQTVAHGLAFTPTRQQIALTAGSATALPFHSAAPDGTNIYVTATLDQPWYWATVGG